MSELVKIDVALDSEFLEFYKKLPKKDNNVFVIFNHNTLYTLHNDNAEYVSKYFLNTTESLRSFGVSLSNGFNGHNHDDDDNDGDGDGGDDNNFTKKSSCSSLTYVCISQARYHSLIRHLLIDNNYSVEIYSKKNPKSQSNKEWQLELEASPGCLGPFEDILMEDDCSSNVSRFEMSSVFINDDYLINVVSIDLIGCIIYLGTFQDNDSLRLLESILVRSNPKECLIQENCKKLQQMLKRNHLLSRQYSFNEGNSVDFEVAEILRDLAQPQYQKLVDDQLEKSSNKILIPLKPLLQKQKLFLPKMKIDDNQDNCRQKYPFGCFFIKEINPDQSVRLDLPSIRHLHLFPRTKASITNQNTIATNLFEFLNHCKTISGMKLLECFIRQPSSDLKVIESRLNIVEYFIQESELARQISNKILAQIPDVTKLYKKFNSGNFNIKDLYKLYSLLEQIHKMKMIFDNNYDNDSKNQYPEAIKTGILDKLMKFIDETKNLFKKLEKSIDLNHYRLTGELRLNSKQFPELAEKRESIENLREMAEKDSKSLNHSYDFDIILEEDFDIGFFYRVDRKYQTFINKNKIYETLQSGEKQFKFLTKILKTEINRKYSSKMADYERIANDYLRNLFDEKLRCDLNQITTIDSFVSLIDVLISFAKVASNSPRIYSKPKILPKENDQIELIDFRHPILEVFQNNDFVPNSIRFDSKKKTYVITGPNMGGKSTLLSSVGLCILMAQIGSFVPCRKAIVSLVDAIYTRITSSDDQNMGFSTFMVEMMETSAILKSTTSNSLVLIDELGKSTATNDGFGLAQAITEYLSNTIKSYTLFATHFNELGLDLIPKIPRLHMKSTFDNDGKLIIHYTAILLEMDNDNDDETVKKEFENSKSFGIEVMRSIKMPQYLIDESKFRLTSLLDMTSIDHNLFLQKQNIDSIEENDFITKIYQSIE